MKKKTKILNGETTTIEVPENSIEQESCESNVNADSINNISNDNPITTATTAAATITDPKIATVTDTSLNPQESIEDDSRHRKTPQPIEESKTKKLFKSYFYFL